ncbi:MAG TPA: carbohydrate ABC transporter permease [Gaiellaceae bacterium]|jgi:ABC-type glycerol-3-phosphate transport system permease component|nr:carbohydrate ABC transporter permease [Gaiellaceae bacterium]
MSRVEAPALPARQRPRRLRLRPGKILRQIVLAAAGLTALYPIVFMASTAFKDRAQYLENQYDLPWPLYFGNFSAALRGGTFFLWFKNSVILTTGSVVLCTLCAALAAFAVARMRFRGRDVFFSLNVALMVVPPVVMLIPLFVLFVDLGLVSTYQGTILIYAGLTIPFSIYLLANFFRAIPRELIESALTDGATNLRVLIQIILPLSAPALVTLVVVNALWVWNELLIALVFLPEDELKTLMVGITVFRSRYNLDVPITMAGMLLASIPMILLYVFGQRFFIRGLTAGAVKG